MTATHSRAGTTDAALRARAAAVIPGGMYGHQSAAGLPAAFPQFMARGAGARVWDVDGREYVDLMCSYGPILLGHAQAAPCRRITAGIVRSKILKSRSNDHSRMY